MNRRNNLLVALSLALAMAPAVLHAQEPKDNKWTKEASKYVSLAALKQVPAEQATLYQQALTSLQEGMTKDPTNPKVWMMAGQVYAGLDNFNSADSAFRKAQELRAEYADEIMGEREQMWLKLFQAGVASMDKQEHDAAIAQLEHAEQIYQGRPEALLNLGALYNAKNQPEKAAKTFQAAIAVTHSPTAEKLTPEQKAQWKSFEDMANLSMAQIEATVGVDAFQAQKYPEAAVSFRKASTMNPYSRDFAYNLAQAEYAYVGKLEEGRKTAKGDDLKKLNDQLAPIYEEMRTVAEKLQQFDPNNPDLYLIQARAYRGLAEINADPKAKPALQDKALAVLTTNQNLPVEISEVAVALGDGEAKVTGALKSVKAKAGDPVKLHVTLLDIAGAPIGTQDVTVAAPATDASANFEATVKTTGALAGWKYEVVK